MKLLHAVLAAALLLGGGAARADDLTLPTGEVLPLGRQVAVWQGKNSYFAGQVEAVLSDPVLPAAIAKDLLDKGVYGPGEVTQAADMAAAAAHLLRTSRAYQLRSITADTMYAAYVLSFPSVSLPKGAIPVQVSDDAEQDFPEGGRAGQSRGGVTWWYRWVYIEPVISGYAMPLWFCTVETAKGEGKESTVTILVTDQASGKHFTPLLEKALEEAR